MIRRVVAMLAVVLAVGIVTAAPALAGSRWLAPVALDSPGAACCGSQVAFDARGDAMAVWLANGVTNAVVRASLRPAGSTVWQPPVALSPADKDSFSPRMVFDGQGNAIAIWATQAEIVPVNAPPRIVAQTAVWSAATGVWDAAVELPTGFVSETPQIAFDARGNAMAVSSGQFGVQATLRPAASGVWEAPVILAPGGGDEPQIAFDGQGNALAVWRETSDGQRTYFVQASLRQADSGLWQPPVTLSASQSGPSSGGTPTPQIAFDSDGNAIVIWVGGSAGLGFAVHTALRPSATGVWQEAVDLPNPGPDARNPEIAFDSHGNAIAVWGVRFAMYAAFRPAASGTWEAPVGFPAPDGQVAPQVAFDAHDNALAVWDGTAPQAALRAGATGLWEQPVALSPAGPSLTASPPQVAFDQQGNALAIWTMFNGPVLPGHDRPDATVETAQYDALGPAIGSLSMPGTGHAHRAIAFSVAPQALWSGLGPTTWNFGDGTTGRGTKFAHTYARRGVYNVTLTSRDALGNASVASQSISIGAAIPPPEITSARLTRSSLAAITFRITLSAAARLDVTIERRRLGRRTVTVIRRPHGRRGRNDVIFRSRSKSSSLPPGRYTARIRAANADGKTAPRALAFTIPAPPNPR